MKVKLMNVRNCFPKYFEPKPANGSEDDYYSGAYPVEPGSANHKALEAAVLAVAKEKWGAKGEAIVKKLREDGDISYKLKPLTDAEGNVYGGFEGMNSLNASSNARSKPVPALWDIDGSPLNDTAVKAASKAVAEGKRSADKAILRKGGEARLYAGCMVNPVVDVWPQDNKSGKRINVQLLGVQFAGDGDAFTAGAVAAADDFDDLSVEEGADDDMLGGATV